LKNGTRWAITSVNWKIAVKGMARKKTIGIMAAIVVPAAGTLLGNALGAIDARQSNL